MKQRKENELVRSLSLLDAVGIGLGAIIGAGIFVVTGVAAGIAGPAFIAGLIIAGIIASFNALSSAQLAAVYPQSGGTYEYGYRLLNPALGFSAGWMFLISKLAAAGIVAVGFGSYFSQLISFASPKIYSIAAVIFLTIANYFGIKKAGTLNLVIVTFTLFSLIYLIISGAPEIRKENFIPFAPNGISGIAESSALLFFAFTGYARIATLAEEVNDPEKTIPRAIIITIVTAILLYAAVSIVMTGVIGTKELSISRSPLQVVAEKLNAPLIKTVITIGASSAMLGVLLSQILGISRMMLAMGRRNDLPSVFQKVHNIYKVPHAGIIVTGLIILVLTITGSFEFILGSAAFTILLYYSIANLAALRQPAQEQRYGKAIPILGFIGCILMSVSLPFKIIMTGVSLLAAGFAFRFLLNKFSKK
jgi:basic amino acid/polyamine antiporter, APA family